MDFISDDAMMLVEPLFYCMLLPIIVVSVIIASTIAIKKYGDTRYQQGMVVGMAESLISLDAT